jgi:uncharacterized surface anchored protein
MKRFFAILLVAVLLMTTMLPVFAAGEEPTAESEGQVKITVTDESGNPVSNVDYEVYTDYGKMSQTLVDSIITGADGMALFTLPYGDYTIIEFYLPGFHRNNPIALSLDSAYVEYQHTITPFYNAVSVNLKDTEGNPIPGATIGIGKYDSASVSWSGYAEITTDSTGAAFLDKLRTGYYYSYVKAATGYFIDKKTYTFSFNGNGRTTEQSLVAQRISGSVKVISTDNSGNPLSGVSYGVYDSQQTLAEELTTGADGSAVSGTLLYGDYELVERDAAEGYAPITEPIHFSIVTHGEVVQKTVTHGLNSGAVRIIVTGDNAPLPGAVFGVYNASTDEQADTLTTGSDGTATSAALSPGEYYLSQLTAPQGFTPIAASVGATVTAGNTADVFIYNTAVPANGYIRLTKLEEGTNKPLAGVVFGVYDASDNSKVEELTTGADGTAVCELPAGVYYLIELRGLDGYEITTDKTGITVNPGETAEITIYNALLPTTGYIRLTKKAEGTDALLPGAVFGVYTVSGDAKVAEMTTGADGTALIELTAGDYYLLEEKAPDGFTLSTERISVTVRAEETANITVTNEETPEVPGSYVKLVVLAEGTGERLPGAVYGLYAQGSDIKLGELTTGADGAASSAALLSGDYYLLGQTAPAGFLLDYEKANFHLDAGETETVTVFNVPDVPMMAVQVTGTLHLTKKAETSGELLPDAVFGIYDAVMDKRIGSITTGADGTAAYGLPEGNFYLVEEKAPEGFALDTERIPFSIILGDTTNVEVTNKAEQGGVRLTAKDGESDAALAEAVFGVYDAGDNKVSEMTTGANGTAFRELPAGVYYLLEQDLPADYSLCSDRYGFYVTTGHTSEVLVVKEHDAPAPDYEIPQTGEPFPWRNYALAALCLCMAFILTFYLTPSPGRKKRKCA